MTLEGLQAEVVTLRRDLDQFRSFFRAWSETAHDEEGALLEAEEVRWMRGPWIIGGPGGRLVFTDRAYVRIATPLATGTYNNYNPPKLETAIVLNVNASGGNLTFTGLFAGSPDRQRILLFRNEDESLDVILKHENSGSDAQNRFRLPNNADLTLNPNESAWLLYDTKWRRWSVAGVA